MCNNATDFFLPCPSFYAHVLKFQPLSVHTELKSECFNNGFVQHFCMDFVCRYPEVKRNHFTTVVETWNSHIFLHSAGKKNPEQIKEEKISKRKKEKNNSERKKEEQTLFSSRQSEDEHGKAK